MPNTVVSDEDVFDGAGDDDPFVQSILHPSRARRSGGANPAEEVQQPAVVPPPPPSGIPPPQTNLPLSMGTPGGGPSPAAPRPPFPVSTPATRGLSITPAEPTPTGTVLPQAGPGATMAAGTPAQSPEDVARKRRAMLDRIMR